MNTSYRPMGTTTMKWIALGMLFCATAFCPVMAAENTKAAPASMMERLGALYTDVGNQVAKSVVQIEVVRKKNSEKPVQGTRDPFGPVRNPNYFLRPDAPVSGVVIDTDGYILTSSYNVTGGEVLSVHVILPSGSRVAATVLGRQENWDLALLKIETQDTLRPITFEEDDPAPGMMVLTVGRSSQPHIHNLTVGAISALNRLQGSAIQTSCRLNYGNTGGALVNLNGALIGITSRIVPNNRSGLNTGVGFAVSTKNIVSILDEMKEGKVWKRTASGISGGPFLGVGQAMPQPDNCPGVQIGRVIPGSAAEDVGLKPGDVIINLNGKKVQAWVDILRSIRKLKVGDKMKLTWLRDGEEMTQTAILKKRPPEY